MVPGSSNSWTLAEDILLRDTWLSVSWTGEPDELEPLRVYVCVCVAE